MADESLQPQPPGAPLPPDVGDMAPEFGTTASDVGDTPPQPVPESPPEPQPESPPDQLSGHDFEPNPGDDLEPEPGDDLEPESERPLGPRRKSTADAALPWVVAAVVVLLLAASGGLISAWIVATLRAVPAPALADVTPSPSPAASSGATAPPTEVASEQPRHTPTPSPVTTQEPPPFIHVVQRGEYLTYIADLYGVSVEDIIALNDIKNPNRIRVGQELLIPGYGQRPSPSPPS